MKKYFFLSIIFISLLSCQDKTQSKTDEVIAVEADATAQISIDGMVCQHGCANFLSEQISTMEGVKDCEVSYEKSMATINYDNSIISEVAFVDFINSCKDSIYSVSNVDVELIKTISKEKIQMH
jgi:Cu+-exporting ATPase